MHKNKLVLFVFADLQQQMFYLHNGPPINLTMIRSERVTSETECASKCILSEMCEALKVGYPARDHSQSFLSSRLSLLVIFLTKEAPVWKHILLFLHLMTDLLPCFMQVSETDETTGMHCELFQEPKNGSVTQERGLLVTKALLIRSTT